MRFTTAAAAAALLSAGLFAAPAAAENARYVFDKAHTQILFFGSHLGFSMSQGEFLEYDGFIEFDSANPTAAKVEVTVMTSSIDMDLPRWDDHMKSKDFFDVENFPAATFKSTAIEVTGANTGLLTGDLTMLDVTKPVTLDVTFNKEGPHPFGGKMTIGFSATGVLKRSEWGMTYGVPGVGDDIELRIEVEAFQP